ARPKAGVDRRDAGRAERVLLPPVGLERDRLRRPRLPARLRPLRGGSARELGGSARLRARSGERRQAAAARVKLGGVHGLRALSAVGLRRTLARWGGRGLADLLRRVEATLRAARARAPGGRRLLAMGRPSPLPPYCPSGSRRRRAGVGRSARAGDRDASRTR